MKTANVKSHTRKRKNGVAVVKTHKRTVGSYMKAVHTTGKKMFGDAWKTHSKHAMGTAHGLRSGKIKAKHLSAHLKNICK